MTISLDLRHDSMYDESPCRNDGSWKIYSFSSRHNRAFQLKNSKYDRIEDILPEGKVPIWLRRKLDVGTAFFLDYYEHGEGCWSRSGHGMQCQFDTARCAGIAIWEEDPDNLGAKTKEERAKDLDNGLEEYNDWCNGHTYGYSLSTDDGIIDDSCGGFIGDKYMFEQINELIADRCVNEDVEITGDMKFLATYTKVAGKLTQEQWDEKQAELEVGAGI